MAGVHSAEQVQGLLFGRDLNHDRRGVEVQLGGRVVFDCRRRGSILPSFTLGVTEHSELEGALKRVVANAKFTNQQIDLALVKDALKDLFVISAKMVSIENIQKTVAEYYNIKLSDLLSKRRSRSITRPRQLAMALTKELTRHSLPEIGEAFNGRDHTTVLHACKKIAELRKESPSHEEDYRNLTRALTN